MALSDPQSIKINGVTSSLPRIESGKNESAYQSSDGLIRLSLASAYGNRTRRVLRLDHSKLTADPFIPSQNVRVSMSNYMVFDVPPAGYSLEDQKKVYEGLKELFTASTDKIITQLLGGES